MINGTHDTKADDHVTQWIYSTQHSYICRKETNL